MTDRAQPPAAARSEYGKRLTGVSAELAKGKSKAEAIDA
jgi:hypothetical protein